MLENSLFGAVKLTKNADPDKYKYPDCSIGFDVVEVFHNLMAVDLAKAW